MPLAALYKTQVIEIAKSLKASDEIINRPPTPDIIPGLTDVMNVGINYETLDRILCLIGKASEEEIAKNLNVPFSKITYVREIAELAKPLANIPVKAKIRYGNLHSSLRFY